MFLENTTDRKIKGTAEIRKTAWIESGRTELISINYDKIFYALVNLVTQGKQKYICCWKLWIK